MPLLDHFRSEWSSDWPWDGVHANWATKIADLLNGGVLPADYHAISLIKRFRAEDLFEVQVFQRFGGAQLRAAIELLSPANKDQPSSRHAFAVKCASYLYQGISVVIIDVVTEPLANLHAELLQLLQVNGEPAWQSPTHLFAVAYRTAPAEPRRHVEMWPQALAVGSTLPTLPLWLKPGFSVPLPLEESYCAMCRSLRIPV